MPDYSALLKEQLIAELNARDTTIAENETEISNLTKTNLDQSTELTTKTAEVTNLTQTVDLKDNEILQLNSANEQLQTDLDKSELQSLELAAKVSIMETPKGVINLVRELSPEEKKELSTELRTTNEGRLALCAITYGR